jgi:hypothetical protein
VYVIEFLCPNNHKIRCPDDQAGRAAKCPKCGVKFLIPSDGAAEKTAIDHPAVSAGHGTNMADSHISLGTLEGKPSGESGTAVLHTSKTASSMSKLSGILSVSPSMARLFTKLWSEKPKDAVLEIILRNGEVYKPEFFSKKLSQQQQGVFAIKEMDGSYTIIVVAWDALSHVQVRKMRDLPDDFSDGKF